MAETTGTQPEKPPAAYPKWAGWLSLGMFVVGCLSAVLSGVVKDINHDKLAFITGAAVFIPLGAMGIGMGYTARIQEVLFRRIESLEQQLRNKGAA